MLSGHCCECPTDAGGEVEVTGTASLQDSSILIIFWTQKSHAPDQAGCQDRHHRLEWHDTWHRKLEDSLDFGVLDKTRTLTANALWKRKGRLFNFHFGNDLIQQRVPGFCYVLESFAEVPFLLKKLASKTCRRCNVDFTLPYSPCTFWLHGVPAPLDNNSNICSDWWVQRYSHFIKSGCSKEGHHFGIINMVQWYTQRSFCIWPGMMTLMPPSRQCPSSVSPGYLLALRSFAWVISAISIVWRMELVTSFDGKLQCSNYLHYIVFRRRVGWSMCHTQCWSQCSTKRFSPIFLLNWEEHNINRKQGHNTISVLNTSKDFILWSLVTPLKTDTESQDHLLSQHFGNRFQLVAFLGFNMWEYRVSTADRWFVDSQVRDMASALRLELDTRRRKVDEVLGTEKLLL